MRIEQTEQGKTKNGLRYYLFPREGFGEQMAAVLVQRGANHLFWKGKDGEEIRFPQGTAHFIEHKLFQQEWGDAFARFTQNGASANAFTDGDQTVYYFTCREKFLENLRLLLEFVQEPYFTKEDTEREKDIIVSEITMYEDDPMWVVYYQMLECMYGKHPIRNRIAGTAETVAEITEQTLQKAYECYYTTDEMALICAGEIPLGEVRRMAEGVAKRETDARVYFPTEDAEIAEKYRESEMGLSVPQFQIGFKLPPIPKQDWLKKRLAAGFCLELLAGESSAFFWKAYEREWLDETLGSAFFCGEGYAFAAFSGSGTHPEETAEFLGKELERLQREGVSQEDFQRIRKKLLGRLLRRLDTPQNLCFGQLAWARMDATAIDLLNGIKSMRQEDAEKMLKESFSKENMVLSVVR